MNTDVIRLHAAVEDRHWWFRGRREIVRRLVRRVVEPRRGATVVDVGCGTGGTLAALAAEYTCIGIDPSAEAVAHARSRYAGVTYLVGEAPRDLPPAARDASIFLLMDVLEHVEDDARLLRDIVLYARPGTHVLITVPADPSLWSGHDVAHGHHRRYDRDSLAALWRGLPVTVRLLSHFNTRLFPAVKLVRVFGRMQGRTAGRAGTDVALPPELANRLLHRVFRGEADRLTALLEGRRRRGYEFGVSLIAILQSETEHGGAHA